MPIVGCAYATMWWHAAARDHWLALRRAHLKE